MGWVIRSHNSWRQTKPWRSDQIRLANFLYQKFGHLEYAIAMENPEMAARIHFKRYPEQKPTAPDEATAIQLGKNALLSRLTNMRIDNMAIKRDKWGYMDRSDVEVYLDILKKIGEIDKGLNPAILYTNELIDDINRFDIAAVKKIAREFKT